MAFSISPTGQLIVPSGIFPSQNLFGQAIGSVALSTPLQAGFTAIQAVTSAPLTAVNGATTAVTTFAQGAINGANTLVLGILGAPFGIASGVSTSGAAFPLPLPFFVYPSGVNGLTSSQNLFPFPNMGLI
jgi:hypothetical protein